MKASTHLKTLGILFFITFLSTGQSSFGQATPNPSLGAFEQFHYGDFVDLQKHSIVSDLIPGNYLGSPYLNDEFLPGYIIMYDTIKYNNVPLRYNIFNEQIEFKVSDTSYLAILNLESITAVVIDGRKFIYADKEKKRNLTKGFYEVLFDGEIQLLAKHYLDFKHEQKALGYHAGKPARFSLRANTYHFKTNNENPIKITSRNQFKSVFNTILSYIDKNKFSLHEEDDLVEIAEFMNSFSRFDDSASLPKEPEQRIAELEQKIKLLEKQNNVLKIQIRDSYKQSNLFKGIINLLENYYEISINKN